jgi:serine/threonine protein phosphatase PrpC
MGSQPLSDRQMNETSECLPPGHQGPRVWKLAATSQRGLSHELDGRPCQDAHSVAMASKETLVIVVADGAGSARFAEVGADLAVRTSTEALCRQLAAPGPKPEDACLERLLIETVAAVRTALETEAIRRDVPLRELATTLILVIVTPEFVAAAQVGDGAAVVGDRDGKIVGLTLPQLGEYVNEAVFVISPDAMQATQISIWHGETANVAVFSDGLQMICLDMPDCTPHQGFFSPLFNLISEREEGLEVTDELAAFLNSQRVREVTDDDLTLVLASLQN